MPCCKAVEFKWCKDLDTVYTDEEGKEYCVFHAPRGNKGRYSIQGFNNEVYKRIQNAQEKKQACDLSGIIFAGPISFRQFNKDKPFPKILFNKATFTEATGFDSTFFREGADFIEARFGEGSSFAFAHFGAKVFFSHASFGKEASFFRASFSEEASFYRANFGDGSHFVQASFGGEAGFAGASFGDEASFARASFDKEATFGGATFRKRAFFYRVSFRNEASFERTKFDKAEFKGDVEKNVTIFQSTATFERCSIETNMQFEAVSLEQVSFLYCDMRKFDFFRCTWPKKKNKQECLYDEKVSNNYEELARLYRQLKQKNAEEHNFPEVSKWHFNEKEITRKNTSPRNFFIWSIYNIYWLFSGYGERPLKAGILLIALLFIISGVTCFIGLEPSGGGKEISLFAAPFSWSDFWTSLRSFSWDNAALLLNNTFQYAFFVKSPDLVATSNWGKLVQTLLTKVLIPLQVALFILALRNRFRR